MAIVTSETKIKGCLLVVSPVHADHRGLFSEIYRSKSARGMGLPQFWDQENFSLSKKDTVRGLHGQLKQPQGKLVNCLAGRIWDVCLDARPNSPTYGKWVAYELGLKGKGTGDESLMGMYIPPGCLHGFAALENNSVVHYQCTTEYDSASDGGVNPFDKLLNIPWPVDPKHVSAKDKALPSWVDYAEGLRYH